MRVPFVFAISHIRDTTIDGGTLWARCRSVFNYLAFYLVDGVTSLNADYIDRLPVRRQRTIHNTVPNDRTAFTWPREYIVWVSGIKPRKNPDAYIELARAVRERGVDCLMVGPIQNPRYQFLETGDEVPPNLHWLGERSPEEVNGIIAGAVCLVHTCEPEGFGNVFIQAWEFGVPTVSVYYDPESLMSDHALGFVSATRSRLAHDVAWLLDNPAEREKMGARARDIAHDIFDTKTNHDRLEGFLRDVV
jgi:glycosyltransferase involved in cell wall biosynthesis